ncbi:MAG: NAD-dependent epimerase/dehydratase family protein [Ignavibacteriales bacterium]|nr:NAD-dependent epimerase/dehydratase family protein [Ignavibacteriales bacterium]
MDSPTTPSDADRGAILVTGGAGYIGSHAAKALARGGPAGRRATTTCRRATAARCAGATSSWADLHDAGALRRTIRDCRRERRSCTSRRWRSVGDSVRDPSRYYREQPRGHARRCCASMVEERVPADHLLVDGGRVRRARPRRPSTEAHDDPADQPVRRDQARHRAGARRTSSAPTGCAASRCGTSTRRAPIRTARSARTTARRRT